MYNITSTEHNKKINGVSLTPLCLNTNHYLKGKWSHSSTLSINTAKIILITSWYYRVGACEYVTKKCPGTDIR